MGNVPVAIVTGASRGIGKAIALSLGKSGFQLVLIAKKHAGLNKLSDEISAIPGCNPPVYFAFDITRAEDITHCIKKVVNDFGRIDVLVNNAGIYSGGTTSLTIEDFRKMVETNLTAQFSFISEVIPVMKEQKSGYIFNIASRAGKTGFAREGGYSASKFGLVGLNESLYRELSEDGIAVTAVCPGWVETDMAYEAGTPLSGDEMIQPDDISKTILWLLSLSKGCRVKEIIIEPSKDIC